MIDSIYILIGGIFLFGTIGAFLYGFVYYCKTVGDWDIPKKWCEKCKQMTACDELK